MKSKFLEHLISTTLVAALLLGLMAYFRAQAGEGAGAAAAPPEIADYVQWEFLDLNDAFEKALFADLLGAYQAVEPGQSGKPGSLEGEAGVERTLAQLEGYRRDQLLSSVQRAHTSERLSLDKVGSLLWMYFKFLLVYISVMALTWYGVQTLAVWRFVRDRRRLHPDVRAEARRFPGNLRVPFERVLSLAAAMVLFSPAYVIAYSIRTEFNTETLPFVILLAVLSNGLLAMYGTRFHAFLKAESRKGYVETAVVKNLDNGYLPGGKGGISAGSVFRLRKSFDGHVFGHIFRNAEFQYLSTLKEQAAYLITGLIIIEMALNIHGHLSYEMLKQILYRNHDIVVAILLLIFLTVKATEILTDALLSLRQRKYANVLVMSPGRGT